MSVDPMRANVSKILAAAARWADAVDKDHLRVEGDQLKKLYDAVQERKQLVAEELDR